MASSSVSDPHHLENPRGDDRAAGAHPVSSGRAVKKGRAGEPQGTHVLALIPAIFPRFETHSKS